MYRDGNENDIIDTCQTRGPCKICEEWKKPWQTWKSISFFPRHCYNCFHAGITEDFNIIGNTLLCVYCIRKYINVRYLYNRENNLKR